MENDNIKKIEKEIKQYKLYKIQTTKAKIREYKNVFNAIKENIVIKSTKNLLLNILRITSLLVAIVLFSIGIFFLFPELIIKIMEQNGKYLSVQEKSDLI